MQRGNALDFVTSVQSCSASATVQMNRIVNLVCKERHITGFLDEVVKHVLQIVMVRTSIRSLVLL